MNDSGSDNSPTLDAAGRYRLESRIATGGMGEVWRATDTILGREVAVKLLKAEYADDPRFRARFETEARHAAALHHPNVASIYDFGEAPPKDGAYAPRTYLVMELVDGQPLSALLAQGAQAGRELDPTAVSDLLGQAGDALGAAHRAGIVHRDVKPANLMVTPDGVIKITDFGIARAADGVGITQTGAVMGTPQYLSPEQARGETASPASDVYSLGVVAFECLAGRRPFDADSPVATALAHLQQPVPDLPDDVPSDLAAVVHRALSKNPADRYPDGAAFAAALRDPATAVLGAPAAAAAAAAAAAVPAADATQVMSPTLSTPIAPPVAAPAAASTTTDPTSPWIPVVIVLLVIALIIIGVVALTGGDDTTDTPTAPTSSATRPTEEPTTDEPTPEPEPETVSVDAGNYIGRPIDEVASDLEGMGLSVTRNRLDNPGDETAGLVDDLNPTGELAPGSTVTVSYWGEKPEPTEEPTPEPTPTPTETPTAAPTGDPTPPTPPTDQGTP